MSRAEVFFEVEDKYLPFVSFRCDRETAAKAKTVAKEQGLNRSSLIRAALDRYLAELASGQQKTPAA